MANKIDYDNVEYRNETTYGMTADQIDKYNKFNSLNVGYVNSNFSTDPVTNFRLPQWGYEEFVAEIDNFRKGITSLTGEPGWFYFKIFFHFDDNYGLLGSVINDTEFTGYSNANTAYNFLKNRSTAPWYKSMNLAARAQMLKRFIKYLSFINSTTPWFFDKINGLDKAVVPTNEFTKERTIEISCLEDAVDMRLTTLFHLYQYVCYDELTQKEILTDNLRKFNMSVALYHVPLKVLHSKTESQNGSVGYNKSLTGSQSMDFQSRMSYKLFTFKGCEFDLESLGGVVPSNLDNSKAFNLGKNVIKIKYDRCFTHLMNEWEQFMIGPDGIYYDPMILVGQDNEDQKARYNIFKERLQGSKQSESGNPKVVDSIIGENFVKYAAPNHTLGNIYNLKIRKMQYNEMLSRNERGKIWLSNLYDFVPMAFKGYVIKKNTDPSKRVYLTQRIQGRYGLYVKPSNRSLEGGPRGYSRLPNFYGLSSILNNGEEQHRYRAIYRETTTQINGYGTENFSSIADLMDYARRTSTSRCGQLYMYGDYHQSLRSIVDSYMYAWRDMRGWWKSMVKGIKQQITGMFKI